MRREEIVLKVNGINYQVEVEPWRTLVEVLRETLGLTGTKRKMRAAQKPWSHRSGGEPSTW
jgi:aerobic-type carbon monoxide dehydrogenase small subunit (CoxS/CutS family)